MKPVNYYIPEATQFTQLFLQTIQEQSEWNVIFLIDKNPPTQIAMLKRASNKLFAPNYYTGIGGKVDSDDKTILGSAYRKLEEETGLKNIKLTEFARCFIDRKYILFYFWGLFSNKLPFTNDGVLEWVNVENVLKKKIIPTTEFMCKQWEKRGFRVDKPFTVYVKEIGKDGTVALVELEETMERLKI